MVSLVAYNLIGLKPYTSMNIETIHVVAAVIRSEGKILVCQRNMEKRHGGLWEFPGGKVKDDESFEDAIRREVSEELKVCVSQVGEVVYSARDEQSPFVVHFMEASVVGTPVPVEHHAIEWHLIQGLFAKALAPADTEFVQSYLAENYERMVDLR
tara:strand:- start:120 stop:584 length:465 start_codon:yes stop_codon:yes gene_type:complete